MHHANGDVANSKRPLLIIPKVQLRLRVTRKVQLRLRVTRRSWQKLFAGKNFVKILVTAQTQLCSYSEQQRAFRNSNICNSAVARQLVNHSNNKLRSHLVGTLTSHWWIEQLYCKVTHPKLWRAHFQKGLNPLLVETELLVEYSTVSETTNFDTNFRSLAYSVPELWSSAISGKFRIFEQNWPFVSKNNVNLIIFSRKIIEGNVFFKIRLKESTFGSLFFWNQKIPKICVFFFNKKQKNKHTQSVLDQFWCDFRFLFQFYNLLRLKLTKKRKKSKKIVSQNWSVLFISKRA